ncbi:MAG: hypothetical protein V7731_16600 [Amphritea sp.]
MNSDITRLMDDLCDTSKPHEASCDIHSSSVQTVATPVPTDLYNDLETLATVYKRDASCIAGDLLTIALKEAFSGLSETEFKQLRETRKQAEQQDALRHMEEQRFDAGCT